MENLTELERAAIIFHVYGGCKDRKILYQIAHGENKVNKLKSTSLEVMCGNWFRSHKIQSGIKYFLTLKQDHETEIINKYIAGLETETKNGTGKQDPNELINFLNLDEFLQYANKQANKIQDEKERRAWVEMIGKYMNFKENEDGEQDQIKAYLPQTCENCELYKRCKLCKLDFCPVDVTI